MLELLEEIYIFLHAQLILKCEITNYLPFIMLMLLWHNPGLTAWNRVLLESLIFAQLMKKPMVFLLYLKVGAVCKILCLVPVLSQRSAGHSLPPFLLEPF